MKNIALVFFSVLVFNLCNAQVKPLPAANAPQVQDIKKLVEFKELDHDFGKIPYGKPVEFDVLIKNVSNDSVKIENVQVGCGCTTPKWQPGPYAAGENFKITLGFNGYTEGMFNKVVTIYFSGGASQLIKFHGETFKAPENPAPANGTVQKLKTSNN